MSNPERLIDLIRQGKTRFGREVMPDSRDDDYPMSSVLKEAPSQDYKYWWPSGYWGDQGYKPHCVGYAASHYLSSGHVTQGEDTIESTYMTDPDRIYREAQKRDQWPGTDYDGTSVRGAMKFLQEIGYVESYHWASNIDDVVQGVLTKGPVIIGILWTEGMAFPDHKGMIYPEGPILGGHAVLVDGYNRNKNRKGEKIFRIKNSWGRGWGAGGFCYMRKEDLGDMLSLSGEACIGREVRKNG